MPASRHFFRKGGGVILFAMRSIFGSCNFTMWNWLLNFPKGGSCWNPKPGSLDPRFASMWSVSAGMYMQCTNTNEQMYIQMKLPLHPVSAGRRTIGVIGSLLEQCVHRSVDKIPQRNQFSFMYMFITILFLFITIIDVFKLKMYEFVNILSSSKWQKINIRN